MENLIVYSDIILNSTIYINEIIINTLYRQFAQNTYLIWFLMDLPGSIFIRLMNILK